MTSNLPILKTPTQPTDNAIPKKVEEEKFDHAFMVALADIVIDSFLLSRKNKEIKPIIKNI